MTAVKGLALGIVVVTGVALEARGEPVRRGSWRWTSWVAGRGVFQTGLSGASAFVPPAPPPARRPAAGPGRPAAGPGRPAARPARSPPPAPDPWQSLGRFATTSPVATALPVEPAPPRSPPTRSSNFGDGPYPQADLLTDGGAQPWYTSPVVTRLFGGVPDAQQRAEFTAAVLRGVEQIYHQNGLPLTVTADPNVRAAHTLSVVSNTSNPSHPDAIGIAAMGGDGFSFIDKFGGAGSIEDAEERGWSTTSSHELMHAVRRRPPRRDRPRSSTPPC